MVVHSRHAGVVIGLALLFVTLAVFWKAGNFDFINFDDPSYVVENPNVATGLSKNNLIWAFTATHSSNWHPVTWVSHMVDVQLFGMNPRGHHLTNVVLHGISTALLFLLFFRLSTAQWQSAFVAVLFALHPLHVESVAWIAERKDVLSALFLLLTLLAYAESVRLKSRTLYALALFTFLLGLMSKPMLVTLPILLLLMDYWPLNRYGSVASLAGKLQRKACLKTFSVLLREKLPFFVLSLCSSAITIYAQKADGAISSLELLPLGLRIENAVLAYVLYMAKLFWPVDLGVFYPLPASIPLWQVACSLIILLGITIGSLLSTRRQPYLLFGWCWFLVTLLPVIGIIQVGGQSLADRYTYIPLIGLLVMMAWGIPAFMQNLPFRKFILTTLALLTITTSAILTWHQLDYWQDSITLYRHTLRVAGGSFVIHNNLGLALADEGLLDEAIGEYQKAIEINPSSVAARSNLGVALASKGSFDAAIREYKAALAIDPDDIDLYNNLGVALARSGAMDEAIEHFRHALTLDPYYAKAYNNLGLALMNEGLVDEAITAYRKALEINPDYSAAYDNLSQALAQKRLDQGR